MFNAKNLLKNDLKKSGLQKLLKTPKFYLSFYKSGVCE